MTSPGTEDKITSKTEPETKAVEAKEPEPKEPEVKESETKEPAPSVASLVAEGKKAIALKDWELGVDKYAAALETARETVDEFDPTMAPLLLYYGKALYELAFSQQGVMGREEVDKQAGGAAAVKDEAPVPSSSNFVFEGDGEEGEGEDAEDDGEDKGDGEAGGAEGEAEEPEDDYNAAWDVLDMARTIYARQLEDKSVSDFEVKEARNGLAESYIALGDVSLETENFPQAAQDYASALKILPSLHSPSSRAIASVHYQLATVLEFTPDGRGDALKHVEEALKSFKLRLAQLKGEDEPSEEISKMSADKKESEKKDVEALIADLEVKIEELKAAPPADDPVSESIKHLLGAGGEGAFGPSTSASAPAASSSAAPVNDLTSMVKKKKKPAAAPAKVAAPAAEAPAAHAEKRKPEEEAETEASKKPKTE